MKATTGEESAAVRASTSPKKLSVRCPAAIGDVVMALPALDYLRRSGFDLECLGGPRMGELLHALPYRVDVVGSGEEEVEQYRQSGALHGLTLRSSLTTALRMHRAGLRPIGYRTQFRSLLLWKGMRFKGGVLARRHVPKVEEYFRLAQFAVSVCTSGREPRRWLDAPFPRLPIAERHRRNAARILEQAGVRRPYIVAWPMSLHGRHRHHHTRCWPHFAEFLKRLASRGDAVVICPGPGEEEECRKLAPTGTVLAGVGLADYLGVLAAADRVIANDTGPMHMAAAVGTPTLGIFGDTSEIRYSPWAEHATHVGSYGRWPELEEVREMFDRLPEFRRRDVRWAS